MPDLQDNTQAPPSAPRLDDNRARGFTAPGEVQPLRYGYTTFEETESPGIALRMIPPGSRVLDVGCGTGDMGCALRDQRGCNVVGIEPHPDRAEFCRTRGLSVHTGYFTPELVPALGRFDVVLFMDVLEHTSDPVELLAMAREALAPNGHVIVSVPNVAHWTVRLRLLAGRFDYEPTGIMDATHLRWFTAKTIESVVSAAGFQAVQRGVSRGAWIPVYWHCRPWRWMRRKRRNELIDRLCNRWPTVFGSQYVIKAKIAC